MHYIISNVLNFTSKKLFQAILSACSPWFEEVLSQSQHPHPVIILKDVRLQDLKNIIRFIYTGEVFVPQSELQDFLKTAELLEIKGLLRDADDPSWSNLSSLFQTSSSASTPNTHLQTSNHPSSTIPPPSITTSLGHHSGVSKYAFIEFNIKLDRGKSFTM